MKLPLLMAVLVCTLPTETKRSPTPPDLGTVSIEELGRERTTLATTVRYRFSWSAPTAEPGQAPIAGYRLDLLHGVSPVDTLASGTTGAAQLSDTLTVVFADSTYNELRGAFRTLDTQGRVSGASSTAPFIFEPFPIPPSPPANIGVQRLP